MPLASSGKSIGEGLGRGVGTRGQRGHQKTFLGKALTFLFWGGTGKTVPRVLPHGSGAGLKESGGHGMLEMPEDAHRTGSLV